MKHKENNKKKSLLDMVKIQKTKKKIETSKCIYFTNLHPWLCSGKSNHINTRWMETSDKFIKGSGREKRGTRID